MRRFPKIIAHRGMPQLERENTLPSFLKAIATGAEMIEFDVRRTSDGIIAVHHDPDVCCGNEKSNICELHYERLNGLIDYHIPTLEEMLSLCAGKIQLDIELKEAGYEQEVLEIVNRYYPSESFIITSFHDGALKVINQIQPGLSTGLLFYEQMEWELLLSRMQACGAICLIPHFWLVTEEFMANAHRHHIPVYVWTVDDRETMDNLARLGVAGIITNCSDLALEVRDEFLSR